MFDGMLAFFINPTTGHKMKSSWLSMVVVNLLVPFCYEEKHLIILSAYFLLS